MKTLQFLLLSLCSWAFTGVLWSQQVPDTSFKYPIAQPRYAGGAGPLILVDAAHHNFHTPDNRFLAFAKLLRADGYRVEANTKNFSAENLEKCKILVISNAINTVNEGNNWRLPNPSAFTESEIQAVKNWVDGGGRLFLIADHMPFAGAATDLGKAFGFEFLNCFAMDNRQRDIQYFHRGNKMLQSHEITNGIDTIVTFTGSAFKIPKSAKPILTLNETYTLLSPEIAWEFTESTPYRSAAGYSQLAALEYGKGHVFVSGEAAMFSAQLAGQNQTPMGMNARYAQQNPQFLLNVIHWLDK
ncbi:MAG: DUF4350 domain-containing protein [Saprospiraceae bacterium]